jgi:hypothetical protein
MTPEGLVKRDIKVFLNALRDAGLLWYFMPVPNGYGIRGIPDFIGCYQGRFFAIEAKSATGAATPWQEACARKIMLAGGLWLLARNVEDIRHVFQRTT